MFKFNDSACACAITRLYIAVEYNGSDDSTYYLAALTMWCLAEMTCTFVVFSAPAVPKVFNISGMKSGLTGVLDSCSTMLTNPSRQTVLAHGLAPFLWNRATNIAGWMRTGYPSSLYLRPGLYLRDQNIMPTPLAYLTRASFAQHILKRACIP